MDRVALITGAGSGIGRSAACALAAAGFAVVLTGRRSEALAETAALMGGEPLAVACDVGDPDSVRALFERLGRERGRLDFLFNNAGMDRPGKALEAVTFSDWTAILATNLTGQFLCAQAAFGLMKEQNPRGGRILNNGSVSAQSPRPNSIPYAASKHGVTGLTKGLMIEGRSHGIAVAQIDIGNASQEPEEAGRVPRLQASGERVPEPFMHFDDVARAVTFVATLPAGTNVPFLTVMATDMPLVGRG